jgi:2-polyprenyl-3-methyl-5-hydroxy-6-metoxy-1,4-benzoquinol methylase
VAQPDADAQQQQLLQKEAQFWDRQEDEIARLYARPHDWRFVPKLADIIIRPRVQTLLRLLNTHKGRIKSLIDVGCGNGWLCHATAKRGIRSIGIDLSPKKIATAQRMAEEQGIAHLCEFVAGDVMQWQPREKVDLLTSHGSLHHFPAFEQALAHLKPDGFMLFVEPNHEGTAPEVEKYLLGWATHPRWRKLFDLEFYLEVTGQPALGVPPPAEVVKANEMNVRHESPAGKEFFGEHIDLDAYFTKRFDVIERHFYHYFSSHATNAFHVFMKSKLVRALWRVMLPWVVRRDTRLLRDPKYQKYAEDALWFMRRKA